MLVLRSYVSKRVKLSSGLRRRDLSPVYPEDSLITAIRLQNRPKYSGDQTYVSGHLPQNGHQLPEFMGDQVHNPEALGRPSLCLRRTGFWHLIMLMISLAYLSRMTVKHVECTLYAWGSSALHSSVESSRNGERNAMNRMREHPVTHTMHTEHKNGRIDKSQAR